MLAEAMLRQPLIDPLPAELLRAAGIEEGERVLASRFREQPACQLSGRDALLLGLTTQALSRIVVEVHSERRHAPSLRPAAPPSVVRQVTRDCVGHAGQLDLHGNPVAVLADDPAGQRRLVVIADPGVVTGLRIGARGVVARAVGDPAMDDKVRAHRGGVVPEVVGGGSPCR
jgi:hypothetical protein